MAARPMARRDFEGMSDQQRILLAIDGTLCILGAAREVVRVLVAISASSCLVFICRRRLPDARQEEKDEYISHYLISGETFA